MTRLDLDARLELARTEAGQGETPSIVWRGREWALPTDLPVEFLSFFDDVQSLPKALETLLGPDMRALDPPVGIREAMTLAEALPELYGLTLGEPVASPGSSAGTGKRSKPTSPGTTGSRSARRS